MNCWQRQALREKRKAADVAGMAMVADLPGEERLEKEEQREVVKLYRSLALRSSGRG